MGGLAVGGSAVAGISGTEPVQLEEFCSLVRFPNSMSRLLRIRCYLLACMHHQMDFTRYTEQLVPPDIAMSLNQHYIIFPCVKDVCAGIETITVTKGSFPELDRFRVKCFVSFSFVQKNQLTLTYVLRLYVAAYQKPDIWKQCWKAIFPVMSNQISRDVEMFVASEPFAVDSFVALLRNSSPF